jgi:hypothetical protein
MPDFDMKFRDHEHFDDWFTLVYGEEDKFEFQYSLCHTGTPDSGGTQSAFLEE